MTFKVLIPLDGSRLAEHSLAFVPPLAHLGDVHVDLLAVVDQSEEIPHLSASEVAERETNVLSTYLREVAGDIRKHLNMSVEPRVVSGSPATEVLDAAVSLKPDMLILSTHGRTGIARMRRGSIADKVIRAVECPVLVVGPKAMEHGQWFEAEAVAPFKSILVPLDGSQLAEQAFPLALRFARAFESRLHLFRAVPVPVSSAGIMGDAVYGGKLIDELVVGSEEYLTQVKEGTELPHGVITKVRVGTPAALIEEYIPANDIDLIVMTTHGRGGVIRTALGSVTDRLLDVGAPVLVVPPQERMD
jgi:nucleotide-binding universal stress UspA family protein